MLTIFKYFIIVFFFTHNICILINAAENEIPDIIATFRGPFEDTPHFSMGSAGICSATISCEILKNPIEMVKSAYNELKHIYKNQCSNINSSQTESLPESKINKDSVLILSENNTNIQEKSDITNDNEIKPNKYRRILADSDRRPSCHHRLANNNNNN